METCGGDRLMKMDRSATFDLSELLKNELKTNFRLVEELVEYQILFFYIPVRWMWPKKRAVWVPPIQYSPYIPRKMPHIIRVADRPFKSKLF